ncbi:unnamed protein product [Gulo gulo]|uniref:Uncharacterized protein n=1 Tax=Gulo gulo TaxID=48420 RepID=A0A9X9M3M8_GULGU|nr:unnamed protein product [Gulo gulo]
MWFWRHKLSLVYITEKPSHPGVTTLKICNREGDTAPLKGSRIFREQTSPEEDTEWRKRAGR